MANSYTKGTVSPSALPLRREHFLVMEILQDYPNEMPPGFDADMGGHTLVEPDFEEYLQQIAPDEKFDGQMVAQGIVYILDRIGGMDASPNFEYSRANDGGDFYLYVEEGGAGDAHAIFLQWVLTTIQEDQFPFITFEYANVCDKMRPGEFGGGAWFITRTGTEFHNTGSWLHAQMERFETLMLGGTAITVLSDGETWDGEAKEVLVTAEEYVRIEEGEKPIDVLEERYP